MGVWGVTALRIARRGMAPGAAARAETPGAMVGAACDAAGVSEGAAPRTGWRAVDGTCTTVAPPPPPVGGRCTSRISDPHLWHTLAVTEIRGPPRGPGFVTILRYSISSPCQTVK